MGALGLLPVGKRVAVDTRLRAEQFAARFSPPLARQCLPQDVIIRHVGDLAGVAGIDRWQNNRLLRLLTGHLLRSAQTIQTHQMAGQFGRQKFIQRAIALTHGDLHRLRDAF